MSTCSSCKKDFIPLLKNNGLPCQTCDRCRSDDKKYKDTHKEQRKEYDLYYRELNKDILKEKAKEYSETNKDKIYAKNKLDRITCECGCTSRRDELPNIKNLHVIKNLWKRKIN